MATTEKYVLGSIATLMNTELNSLASSATGAAIATTAYNNIQAGGGGDGYTLAQIELVIAAPGSTLTASPVYVWFLQDPDATNYEDGGAAVIPGRQPDVIIPLRLVSTAQRETVWDVKIPPGTWKALLSQVTGVSWAASGNTLKIVPYTRQGV